MTLFSRMGEEAGTWQTPACLRVAESIGMGSILIALGRHAYACGPWTPAGLSFLPPGRGFFYRRIPGYTGGILTERAATPHPLRPLWYGGVGQKNRACNNYTRMV